MPSQSLPARHVEHEVRIEEVPPEVNDVAALHFVHPLLPPELKKLSKPQGRHVDFPAELYCPAPQGTAMLLPEHLLPAEQGEHDVLVVDVPPPVRLPAGQTLHDAAPFDVAYWSSWPHPRHFAWPAVEKVPASHSALMLEPSAQ